VSRKQKIRERGDHEKEIRVGRQGTENRGEDIVPDKEMGSCLDPELPGTGLQKEEGEGPGPPYPGEKSQLEPSRDRENMRRDREDPIPDVMKEDQWASE
jgi:hypothetical protein